MNDWTTTTLRRGNCTIIVHRPNLTKEEAARRERQVQDVLEVTMRAYIERKEKNK